MRFWGKMGGVIGAWMFPRIPDAIRPALLQTQSNDINRHVPMLMSVACLNVVIIIAFCAQQGFPLYSYSWMVLLIGYCIIRIAMRRMASIDKVALSKMVAGNATMSVVLMTLLGGAASYTFAASIFNRETLIPVSLVCGATAIAHCLYTLRFPAILVLVLGIFPVSVTMIITGDFRAMMMGISFLSVAMLMIRFVAAQSDQLLQNLLLQHQVRQLADTDALTGLSNRRAIMATLEALEAKGEAFGIALIDLDGFKQINDTLGHQAGDMLLQNVSARLSAGADVQDQVGRLGGDEFLVVLKGVANQMDVSASSSALLAALCRPIDLDGRNLPIGASLGSALFPEDGATLDVLLKHADEMLYAAKRKGRDVKRQHQAA
jgi:diguanylate cyclase (GGDEF)-like protein